METISTFLTADHRVCDDKFANLENAVAAKNWDDVKEKYDIFVQDLLHHFEMEETIFFPVFEENTGMSCGPTQVMKMEHEQMRQIITQLQTDIDKQDDNHFFGVSETLMMLMQQHNMKEEQMLYKMADMHLSGVASNLIEQMKAI